MKEGGTKKKKHEIKKFRMRNCKATVVNAWSSGRTTYLT